MPKKPTIFEGKFYCLLIGISQYKFSPALSHPVQDLKQLKQILQEKYWVNSFHEIYDTMASPDKLGISEGTAKRKGSELFTKMGVGNRLELYKKIHAELLTPRLISPVPGIEPEFCVKYLISLSIFKPVN